MACIDSIAFSVATASFQTVFGSRWISLGETVNNSSVKALSATTFGPWELNSSTSASTPKLYFYTCPLRMTPGRQMINRHHFSAQSARLNTLYHRSQYRLSAAAPNDSPDPSKPVIIDARRNQHHAWHVRDEDFYARCLTHLWTQTGTSNT